MRRPCALALALAGTLSVEAGATAAPSDPRAVEVADRVMAELGGRERWNDLRIVRWTFQPAAGDTLRPARRHAWDKHTGWHRVEGTNRAGQAYCAIANLNDSTGMAWVGGRPVEGDSLRMLIRSARAFWTNDSYWFLMPYKLRDPGVTLGYEGEVRDAAGTVCDRITLSFENVGLTPGDRYWVDVNRATHRIEGWEYVLQGTQPPPTRWTWEGWEEHGGLWFPTAHRTGNRAIFTRAVETAREPRPGEFTAP